MPTTRTTLEQITEAIDARITEVLSGRPGSIAAAMRGEVVLPRTLSPADLDLYLTGTSYTVTIDGVSHRVPPEDVRIEVPSTETRTIVPTDWMRPPMPPRPDWTRPPPTVDWTSSSPTEAVPRGPTVSLGNLPASIEGGRTECEVTVQVAGMELEPGVAVAVADDGMAYECGTKNPDGTANRSWRGVVDPFLLSSVAVGQRFWMMAREPQPQVRSPAPPREADTPLRVRIGDSTYYATSMEWGPLHQGRPALQVILSGSVSVQGSAVVDVPSGPFSGNYRMVSTARNRTRGETTLLLRRVGDEPARDQEQTSLRDWGSTVRAEDVVAAMRALQRVGAEPQRLVVSNRALSDILQERPTYADFSGGSSQTTFLGMPVLVTDQLPPGNEFYVTTRDSARSVRDFNPSDEVVPRTAPERTHALRVLRDTTYRARRLRYGDTVEVRASEVPSLVSSGNFVISEVWDAIEYVSTPGGPSRLEVRRAGRRRHTDDPPDPAERDLGEDQ